MSTPCQGSTRERQVFATVTLEFQSGLGQSPQLVTAAQCISILHMVSTDSGWPIGLLPFFQLLLSKFQKYNTHATTLFVLNIFPSQSTHRP